MAAMDKLHIFLGTKTEKLKSVIIYIVHINHHLEMCMWFYWNLKWPPQIDFLNNCDHKKSSLIYGGGWYRTSGLLFCLFSKGFVYCKGMKYRRNSFMVHWLFKSWDNLRLNYKIAKSADPNFCQYLKYKNRYLQKCLKKIINFFL